MPKFLFAGCMECWPRLSLIVEASFSNAEIISFDTIHDALAEIDDCTPTLLLADIDTLGDNSIVALKDASISHHNARFAIISRCEHREYIMESLTGGLHGFLLKDQSDEELLAALNSILSGSIYIACPPGYCGTSPSKHEGFPRLTQRQRQVLHLLSLGMSNKEIARILRIAESTTRIHAAMLMRALGVRNRTEAAFAAGRLIGASNSKPGWN